MHGSKLFVGGLTNETNTEFLTEMFSEYGTVLEIKIIEDKGFGFITMSTQVEAEKAKAELNGKQIGERTLKVNEAKEREKKKGRRFTHNRNR